jgi:hypothetical protein
VSAEGRQSSSDFAGATDYFDVDISGGATRLTVDTLAAAASA